MNPIEPIVGSSAISSFLLFSIPLFALAWLVSQGLYLIMNRYLREQQASPELSLDDSVSQEDTARAVEQAILPNVWTFAFTLYCIAAPFLFSWLTLSLSSIIWLVVILCGSTQIILIATSHSAGRKMQANASMALFVAWCVLCYMFLDLTFFFL